MHRRIDITSTNTETIKQRKEENLKVHAAKHQSQLASGTKQTVQNGMMRLVPLYSESALLLAWILDLMTSRG